MTNILIALACLSVFAAMILVMLGDLDDLIHEQLLDDLWEEDTA